MDSVAVTTAIARRASKRARGDPSSATFLNATTSISAVAADEHQQPR